MKREADDEDTMSSPVKRRRNLDDPEIRILIPSKAAGSIIGKCGHNITRLRTEYNASVTVPDCPGPERILTICADLETILRVVENVIPNIEDADNSSRSRDNEVDLRLLVHQSQAGCIIGKAGFKIKELREKTGARIKIFSNCCPQSTDRVCQISGRTSTCVDSIREIMELIKTSPVKGMSNPYDPHNYDDYFAHEYGGYGEQDKAGRGGGGGMRGMPGGPPPPMGGRGGGGGRYPSGPRGRGGMGDGWSGDEMDMFSRNAPPPPGGGMGPPRGVGGYGGRAGVGGGSGYRVPPPPPPNGMLMGDSNMGPGSSMLAPKTSTQVTIPKEVSPSDLQPLKSSFKIPKTLAGAIIGKGGARIRKIRADSGAGITIDEALVGSNDRIITITGTTSQIQMAQYLLQQSCQAGMDPSSNYP